MKKILSIVIFAVFSNNVLASPPVIVDRTEKVDGKSLDEYSNLWWQWAKSMPNSESPIIDKTGTKCHVNQEGPVWFLAGGYGASKINRKCKIPATKYIFFPVINMLYYPKAPGSVSCKTVRHNAAINNNLLKSFVVNIDNEQVVNPALHRHKSQKCFDLLAAIPEEFNAPKVYPSATDGYWVMLNPLAEGIHKISFKASYGNPNSGFGMMYQDIEYEVEIIEP